jgi:hypothetical protein
MMRTAPIVKNCPEGILLSLSKTILELVDGTCVRNQRLLSFLELGLKGFEHLHLLSHFGIFVSALTLQLTNFPL